MNDDGSCGIPFFLLWINSTKATQVWFSEYFDVSSNTAKQKRSDSRVNLKLEGLGSGGELGLGQCIDFRKIIFVSQINDTVCFFTICIIKLCILLHGYRHRNPQKVSVSVQMHF